MHDLIVLHPEDGEEGVRVGSGGNVEPEHLVDFFHRRTVHARRV